MRWARCESAADRDRQHHGQRRRDLAYSYGRLAEKTATMDDRG